MYGNTILFLIQSSYFIINRKITDFCSRNRSAILAYMYIQTHTNSCRQENDDDRQSPMPTLDLTGSQTHTHTSRDALLIALPRALPLHTPISSCLLEIRLIMTHTYTHPYLLIACTNPYFSFTFPGAFPLHACGVTRNWRTYFTSMRRVFLVETAVLHTVATVRQPGVDRPFSSFIFLL